MESSFIVTDEKSELPVSETTGIEFESESNNLEYLIIIPIVIIIIIIGVMKKRSS